MMVAIGSAAFAQPELTSPLGPSSEAGGAERSEIVNAPTSNVLPDAVTQSRAATWPLVIAMHASIGAEPHDRGTPVAFGAGVELLWRARLGGFAELLASEGTPIAVGKLNNEQQPFLGDRISVPFGLAARPLATFGAPHSYLRRLLGGFDMQLGLTVEYVRTSDDEKATAGLHAGLALEIPVYGGTAEGGLALRVAARFIFTPEIYLDSRSVFEPSASTQVFGGISYYP